MPRAKRKLNFSPRSSRKRARRAPRRGLSVARIRGITPLPQVYRSTFKYADQFDLTAPISTANVWYSFRLNSLFDPNFTGGGTQPYGFDQVAAWFAKYRVWSVKYLITAYLFSGADQTVVKVQTRNDDQVQNDAEAVIMEPRTFWRVLNDQQRVIRIRGRSNLPNLTGVSAKEYRDENRYSADVTTNPVDVARLNIGVSTRATSIQIIRFVIQMKMTAEFYEPILVGPS